MLIDKLRNAFVAGMTLTPVREWVIGGHEVGLYRVERPADADDPGSRQLMLACECDVPDGDEPRVIGGDGDPDKCRARLLARSQVMREANAALAPILARDGLNAAILEVHRRVESGEYLGQHFATMIYVQEVAEVLAQPQKAVWAACGELYAEEKLELNGAILTDYVRRFRLPPSMASVMAYVVEEPLGWPNGDAGGGQVAGFEMKVQEATGLDSGKGAFGPGFPEIDPAVPATYAFDWLAAGLAAAAASPEALEELRAVTVESLAAPGLALATAHPEIDARVFAMYVHELLRLSLERIEIEASMREGITPDVTLREMAEYFAGQASRFRSLAKKPQG